MENILSKKELVIIKWMAGQEIIDSIKKSLEKIIYNKK